LVLDLDTFSLRAKRVYPEKSLRKKLIVLKLYDKFLEKNKLEPSLESLNLWLDELTRKGLSDGTIYVYFYDVLSYFDLMMVDLDERKLRSLKRRLPAQSVGQADFLTEEEVAKLIEGTPSLKHRLIFSLMYAYSRRLSEVLLLKKSDIDFEKNTVTFTILKKKREEKATFELEPWIKEMLVEYLKNVKGDRLFDISGRAVEIAFKKMCEKVGIQAKGRRLAPHILRHSRLTHLRDRGVPLEVVSKVIARHSRFDTTVQFYRGISEEVKASIPKAEEIFKSKV